MRGRRIVVSLASLALAGSLFASTPAMADKPSNGCPSNFQGPIALGTYSPPTGFLGLPHHVAGILALAKTVTGLTDVFNATDHNGTNHDGNGLVCYKAPPGSENANDSSGWRYSYTVVDDNASSG